MLEQVAPSLASRCIRDLKLSMFNATVKEWCNDLVTKPMSKISHKHTYCVCLCKSANDISLGEDMPNSSNERTIMNCAKDVSLITVKNGCDS